MLELEIQNIVMVSPMYKQLQPLIEKEQIKKNFRYLPEEEFRGEDLDWADAMVCFNLKSNIDYSRVKWVHSLGAGVDRFLFGKTWPQDVLLTRTICSFGQRIAEYCLSYILKDLQFHDYFREAQCEKMWSPCTPKLLSDQKVMVYGTGEIGQTVAKIFSTLGMEVYGISLSGVGKDHFKKVEAFESAHSILGEVDFVINTLPLTEKTVNLFSANVFERMQGVGFINVGRGATINEHALLKALNGGHVRFAVLDVFAIEPLPSDNPLWEHHKVVVTPHISAVTTPEEGVACFIETLKNLEAGKPLRNTVDVMKGY
ncbi:D-2-hydroxyacid dehydrogenase [Pseudoneobacillus sp. C159]